MPPPVLYSPDICQARLPLSWQHEHFPIVHSSISYTIVHPSSLSKTPKASQPNDSNTPV